MVDGELLELGLLGGKRFDGLFVGLVGGGPDLAAQGVFIAIERHQFHRTVSARA